MSDDIARSIGQIEGKLDMLLLEQRRGMEESRSRHTTIAARFDENDDRVQALTSKVEKHQMRLDTIEPRTETVYTWMSERITIEKWLKIKVVAGWGIISAIGVYIGQWFTSKHGG